MLRFVCIVAHSDEYLCSWINVECKLHTIIYTVVEKCKSFDTKTHTKHWMTLLRDAALRSSVSNFKFEIEKAIKIRLHVNKTCRTDECRSRWYVAQLTNKVKFSVWHCLFWCSSELVSKRQQNIALILISTPNRKIRRFYLWMLMLLYWKQAFEIDQWPFHECIRLLLIHLLIVLLCFYIDGNEMEKKTRRRRRQPNNKTNRK